MMLLQKVFCVRDLKAGVYLKPFVETHTANAIRGFQNIVNESGSTINQYPDDFALHELGEFDISSGELHAHESPKDLGKASGYKH